MGRSVVAKIVWDQRGRRVPTSVADAAPDTVVTKKDNDRGSARRGGSAPTPIRTAGVAAHRVQSRARSTDARNSTSRLSGHHNHRLPSRLLTARHSCETCCSGPVRCAAFGQVGICRHSSFRGFPGWAIEMGCLQRMHTGAIPASFRQVDWTVTTPSDAAAPRSQGARPGE